jgi:hypothetical protein
LLNCKSMINDLAIFIDSFASQGVLSKDPDVWQDLARPANTCIPPTYPRNTPMQPHSIPIPKNTLSRNKKIAMKIAQQYTIYNAATILFSNVESPNSFAWGTVHQQRVLAQLLLAWNRKCGYRDTTAFPPFKLERI